MCRKKKLAAQLRESEERAKRLQEELDAIKSHGAPQGVGHRPKAEWVTMNNCNPVPIAPPADFIQLTPIVQPVPLVPYSTQTQPLLMVDTDSLEDED